MQDRKRCIANEKLETTGFAYTPSLISGKYKMTILYTLMEFGTVRYDSTNSNGIYRQSHIKLFPLR